MLLRQKGGYHWAPSLVTTHSREIHMKYRSRSKQLLPWHAWWPKSTERIPGPTVKQQRGKGRSCAIFTDGISQSIFPRVDFHVATALRIEPYFYLLYASIYTNRYTRFSVMLFARCFSRTALCPSLTFTWVCSSIRWVLSRSESSIFRRTVQNFSKTKFCNSG